MCKMPVCLSPSLWHLYEIPSFCPRSLHLSCPKMSILLHWGRLRLRWILDLNVSWPFLVICAVFFFFLSFPLSSTPLSQSPSFSCSVICWVLLPPLCTGENLHWFPSTRPKSMLLKILDTFYLRAKACIFCFDMAILIHEVAQEKGVGAGGWVDLSLSLSVSGNTAILNGFPVLSLLAAAACPCTSLL